MLRYVFMVAFVMLTSNASAQQQERTYTLTVTATQINYIASVLQEQKYKDVVKLLESLGTQVDAQNKAAEKPKENSSSGE